MPFQSWDTWTVKKYVLSWLHLEVFLHQLKLNYLWRVFHSLKLSQSKLMSQLIVLCINLIDYVDIVLETDILPCISLLSADFCRIGGTFRKCRWSMGPQPISRSTIYNKNHMHTSWSYLFGYRKKNCINYSTNA